MADDIIDQLHELRRYAAGLRDSIVRAQSNAPQRAEGRDSSGAIRAELGPDGVPESVFVDADWSRRLDAARFGAAVVEACQAAARERMAQWSRALDGQDWRSRADGLRGDEPRPDTDPLPAGVRDAVSEVRTRPIDELAEDMMRAFDGVGELAAASPLLVTGAGASGSGRLVVTLSKAGLVSCSAEARWVSQQSGSMLTTALSEALAAARGDLARAAGAPNPAAQLDQLFAEALAILADQQRPTDQQHPTDHQRPTDQQHPTDHQRLPGS
ncbi:hypothetical protein HC028_26015 [Planosporangium flavigriseum]|uniref:YbaB/EbfC DNA-binding family protein n=1 Tax=Planosporangium flavigriseum TaxID=373681 RepID=A0A8J3LNN6_9ACTN|nr:hypothetical protein [Planosporangium flavigriseum]NJC67935.1 hypothetical protein [Planosporangium flavigriseum]GIG76478.1 hypothetical protein Pfl04_48820 [Planosporangium flavigriseum]